ncbi:hypothetical protein I9W82_001142 [Candida metapsilosis]|uniref:DUF7082 domain-containing protein n=1 Tax=Candida metapsilosis TaxID=273372 RepID=A0A8H7ZJQ2_9ASCO|nr:hypothetical protein I9W82_001142 [Candida metapsilosis]
MFTANSPLLPFNRFDMLDPNEYSDATNNRNPLYAVDEAVNDASTQGLPLNTAVTSNYLVDENQSELFSDDLTPASYVATATTADDVPYLNNNLYSQSINVNLNATTPLTRVDNTSSSYHAQHATTTGQSMDSLSYQSSSQYHYPLSSSVSSSIQSLDAGHHSSSYNLNYPTHSSSLESQYPPQGTFTTSMFAQPPPLPITSSSPPQFTIGGGGSSIQSQSVYFDGLNNQSLGSQPPLSAVSSDQLSYSSSPGSVTTTRQQIPESQPQKKSPTQRQQRRSSRKEKKSPKLTTSIIQHPSSSNEKRYRILRGISAGGSNTRPPKEALHSNSIFLPVELNLVGAAVEDVCCPKWSKSEKQDRRRIIRVERIQNGPQLTLNFSVVGSAKENPKTLPPPPNVDVVEVSCLECDVRSNDDYESQSSDDETGFSKPKGLRSKRFVNTDPETGRNYQYYITSVELIEIVELLIGSAFSDPAERRKERGRVRSNLVPFWSKKSISARMSEVSSVSSGTSTGSSSISSRRESTVSSNSAMGALPTTHSSFDSNSQPTNQDYRSELAKRIMSYDIRKPRGFDKEVRILRWDKLIPALKRASLSYYTEIPQGDELYASFSNF